MCYTAQASLTAWFVNLMVCAVLLSSQEPQYRALAYFFLFAGTMQLYDYVFHTYPDRNPMNYAATKLAMLTNHAVPLVLAAVIVYVMKQDLTPSSKLMVGAYALVALLYTVQSWPEVNYTTKEGDHVVWEWNRKEYSEVFTGLFLLTILVLFKTNFKRPLSVMSVAVSLVSFALAYMMFHKHSSTGRFWCYFAVFVPMMYVPMAVMTKKMKVLLK